MGSGATTTMSLPQTTVRQGTGEVPACCSPPREARGGALITGNTIDAEINGDDSTRSSGYGGVRGRGRRMAVLLGLGFKSGRGTPGLTPL